MNVVDLFAAVWGTLFEYRSAYRRSFGIWFGKRTISVSLGLPDLGLCQFGVALPKRLDGDVSLLHTPIWEFP